MLVKPHCTQVSWWSIRPVSGAAIVFTVLVQPPTLARMNSDSNDTSIIDALYRISRVVNETDDPRAALESIMDAIMAVLPAANAGIALINPDTNCLEIEVMRGFDSKFRHKAIPIGEGVTGWVALHGKALYVPDVLLDARYIELDPSVRSELAVPLIGENSTVLGVINVDNAAPDAFSAQHRKILILLAAEASRAINRIWLIGQLRLRAARLQALIRTGRSIVSKRNTKEILNQITGQALRIINTQVASLFLIDTKTERLELKALAGPADFADYRESLALGESAIGTAVRRRKTIEIANISRTEEHHFVPIVQAEGLVSLLSCPLFAEDQAIGVLNVYTRRPHRFNNEEKRLLEALASLGGVAIQNARLYERIFATEDSLRKTQQLTTLGLLSAEIAHEIRNPLTVIRLLFESLTLDFQPDDPRSKDVSIISEKLDHLEGIVSRVLNFGKSNEELRARYPVNALIEDTLYLVRLKFRQLNIDLQFEPCPSEPLVEVHKGQLQQAILNLLLNAANAMPNGGEIRVRVDTTPPAAKAHCTAIRISDTGEGIPPEIRDRIFESFLSGRSQGTGLGLAIVKRILRSHGGDVAVESSSNAGTTLCLQLPLHN